MTWKSVTNGFHAIFNSISPKIMFQMAKNLGLRSKVQERTMARNSISNQIPSISIRISSKTGHYLLSQKMVTSLIFNLKASLLIAKRIWSQAVAKMKMETSLAFLETYNPLKKQVLRFTLISSSSMMKKSQTSMELSTFSEVFWKVNFLKRLVVKQ